MSLSAQNTLLSVIASAVPVIATVFLGWFAVAQPLSIGGGGQVTLIWSVTLAAAAVSLLAVIVTTTRIRSMNHSLIMSATEAAQQAVSGDRNSRVTAPGDDDFATFARALNRLIATRAQAQAQATPDAPDAVALQAQIEKLLTEVSAVGDGDLRVQAEVTPDTLGVLADSFNFMIEELAKVVGRVQATTNQVTSATRRLLDRSADVSSASEAQVQQISLASDRVAQLADFVQLSAETALQSADAARQALQSAREGQSAVIKTTDGMAHIRENVQDTAKKIKRLGERSQEVGEIVRLIEDIAEQTNILALNAAIQSAMAGEHGRGFNVVADEIRVLAERVAEATKRVGAIVKTIQGDTYEAVVAMEESTQDVIEGSRLADEAGRALQNIYASVERQATMINDIARGANERRLVAETVAVAMGQIAEVTRQTNSATQDSMGAVSYLAELAEQLRASVATFRLPDHIAEAAGLPPMGLEAPITVGASAFGAQTFGGQVFGGQAFGGQAFEAPNWGPGLVEEFPALPAGPIQAAYAPAPNAFDIGAYDAAWTEAPQEGAGS